MPSFTYCCKKAKSSVLFWKNYRGELCATSVLGILSLTKSMDFYLDQYANISYRRDKIINIILALASSSSIAAWAIWGDLDFFWALFIAASQVITAVKPHLPYSKRMDTLGQFSAGLQVLFNKTDYHWYRVSNGDLTESEINELLFELKGQSTDISNKYLKIENLPENEDFKLSADLKAEHYFAETY